MSDASALTARLSRIRSSIRGLFALDGLSRLVLTFAALVCLTFGLDWIFHLPVGVRIFFLAAGGLLLLIILVRRLFRPLGVRISDDDLALLVERTHPELNDRLISAIQLARDPQQVPKGDHADHVGSYNSPELVGALMADAQRATESVDFNRVLVGRHVGKVAFWGVTLAALLIAGAVWNPEGYASIYFNRILGGAARWPQRTHLTVLEGEKEDEDRHRVHARGDDLTLAVHCKGKHPSRVLIYYEFDSGERGRDGMTPAENDLYLFTFTRLSGPFTFHVVGGDDKTDRHTVDTVNPPTIETVKVFYSYPKYMNKPDTPPDQPETLGNVAAPLNTKVRFEAVANEELSGARLTVGPKGKEQSFALPVTDRRFLTGGFTVTEKSSAYAIELRAANGLTNRDLIRFTIKGLQDQRPTIRVNDPLGDEPITELCERPLAIETEDDHGIKRIALERRIVSQQEDKSKDWSAREFTRKENSRNYGELKIRSTTVLDVAELKLKSGDHVEIRFRAEDYKDVGAPNVRTSKVFKLSVVSVGLLEKDLQEAIEKIKIVLRKQKSRQEAAWDRSSQLVSRYGQTEQGVLKPSEQSEVRHAGLEQNDISSKLEAVAKDLRHVQRRGVYNKIYNESAAAKLQTAIDELHELAGDPEDTARNAISRVAASGIDQAAGLRTGAERADALRAAQSLQNAVAAGIQRALDQLDKWSSYQEVIRLTRQARDSQKDVNIKLKEEK